MYSDHPPSAPLQIPSSPPTSSSSTGGLSVSPKRHRGSRGKGQDREFPPHLQGGAGAVFGEAGGAGAGEPSLLSRLSPALVHQEGMNGEAHGHGSPPKRSYGSPPKGGARHRRQPSHEAGTAALSIRGTANTLPASIERHSDHLAPLPSIHDTPGAKGRETSTSRWATTPPTSPLHDVVAPMPHATKPAPSSPAQPSIGLLAGMLETLSTNSPTAPSPLHNSIVVAPSLPVPMPTSSSPSKVQPTGGRSRWDTDADEEEVVPAVVERKRERGTRRSRTKSPNPSGSTPSLVGSISPPTSHHHVPIARSPPTARSPPAARSPPVQRPEAPTFSPPPPIPVTLPTPTPDYPSPFSSSPTKRPEGYHIDWADDDDEDLPELSDDWILPETTEVAPVAVATRSPPPPPVNSRFNHHNGSPAYRSPGAPHQQFNNRVTPPHLMANQGRGAPPFPGQGNGRSPPTSPRAPNEGFGRGRGRGGPGGGRGGRGGGMRKDFGGPQGGGGGPGVAPDLFSRLSGGFGPPRGRGEARRES